MHTLCLQQIKIMWNLFLSNDNNNNIAKTMMAIIWKRNSFSFYDASIDMFPFFFCKFLSGRPWNYWEKSSKTYISFINILPLCPDLDFLPNDISHCILAGRCFRSAEFLFLLSMVSCFRKKMSCILLDCSWFYK